MTVGERLLEMQDTDTLWLWMLGIIDLDDYAIWNPCAFKIKEDQIVLRVNNEVRR